MFVLIFFRLMFIALVFFLCEMCIRELPDPERRDEQVLMITNRVIRDLVRRCLQTDPEARPTMQEIIDELSRAV